MFDHRLPQLAHISLNAIAGFQDQPASDLKEVRLMGSPGPLIDPVLVFVLAVSLVAGAGTALFDIVETLAADLASGLFPLQFRQPGSMSGNITHEFKPVFRPKTTVPRQ
jgi:hypothetical protein